MLWRIRKAFDSTNLNWQGFLNTDDICISFNNTADFWLDAHALLSPLEPASAQAEAYINLGNLEEGLSHLTKAFKLIQETGERCWEAELYRLQDKIYRLQGNDIEAEKTFHKAIETAKYQNAKMWELQASIDLAKLLNQQARLGEAGEAHAEIYGLFTEGFDTPDLVEARTLLDDLSYNEPPVT